MFATTTPLFFSSSLPLASPLFPVPHKSLPNSGKQPNPLLSHFLHHPIHRCHMILLPSCIITSLAFLSLKPETQDRHPLPFSFSPTPTTPPSSPLTHKPSPLPSPKAPCAFSLLAFYFTRVDRSTQLPHYTLPLPTPATTLKTVKSPSQSCWPKCPQQTKLSSHLHHLLFYFFALQLIRKLR